MGRFAPRTHARDLNHDVGLHDGIVIAALPCPSSRQVVGESGVEAEQCVPVAQAAIPGFTPTFATSDTPSYMCVEEDNSADL